MLWCDVMAQPLPLPAFIFLSLVAAFGAIGNIFIIAAVCLQKRLRVRGNAFIINLAVADLIICGYIMPVGLVTAHFLDKQIGGTWCDVNAFLVMCTCGVSTQSLMMISIERYVHICRTSWYRKVFSRPAVGAYVALSWIYSAAWTIHGWTGWTRFIYGEDVYACMLDGSYSLSYDFCVAAFGMVIPIVVVTFCYINIFRKIRKSRSTMSTAQSHLKVDGAAKDDPVIKAALLRQRKKLNREVRLLATLLTIVVVFGVLWSPAAVVLIMSGVWENMPKLLYPISTWMALCNSSVNSTIYGAMNQNFRRGYRQFFFYMFCVEQCRKQCSCRRCRGCMNVVSSTDSTHHVTSKASNQTSADTNVTQVCNVKSDGAAATTPSDHINRNSGVESKRKSRTKHVELDTVLELNSTGRSTGSTVSAGSNTDPMLQSRSSTSSSFVQYVHILDDEEVDFFSSPILGASYICSDGKIDTRL